MMATVGSALTRLQVIGVTLLLVLCVALLAHAALWSPAAPFVTAGTAGEWITYPLATTTDAIAVDLENVPTYEFRRNFRLEAIPPQARLHGRALRTARIEINGRDVDLARSGSERSSRGWKAGFDSDVSALLRIGLNEIRVHVRHAKGPPLLQLSLEGDGLSLRSDTLWSVGPSSMEAIDAVVASDVRLHPEALAMSTPTAIFAERLGTVLLLFVASCLAYALLSGRMDSRWRQRAPAVTLAIVTLFWLVVFATRMIQLPVMMGFDIPSHLLYIDYLLEHGRLPLADEGWSTYHPPVFYVLTAGLVGVTQVERETAAGQLLYRLIPFLAGLANIWITYFLARRLFAGDALRTSLAVAAAGLLPMNLYMSAYVSNEQLHGAWVSLSLLLTTGLLLDAPLSARRLVLLSGTLGLAILTKFTSVLIVPVVVFFIAARAWLVDRRSLARAAGIGAAILLGVALVGGWFYLRNWIHFGNPLVGNWDVTGRFTWWEQPGFHSLEYYTRFGTSLRYPFFAGTASFWDGIYSTLWGDGLVAGMVSLKTRHPMWNYDFMTLGYLLAAPASGLVAVGFGRAVHLALSDPDPGRRLTYGALTTTLFVVAFALLRVTITLPYYAQAKAFYGIATVVPLALVTALGLAAIPEWMADRRHAAARTAYFGWLGALASVLALSFLG